MFDAKKLLEMLMKGAQPAPAPAADAGGLGGLGDLLGKVLGQQGGQAAPQQSGGQGGGSLADILGKLGQAAPQAQQRQAQAAPEGGGTLGDLLGKVLGQGQQQQQAPAQRGAPQQEAAADHGGLADLLRKLQEQMGGAAGGSGAGAAGGAGGGGLGDILGQVFGQAKAGVSEGARRIDDATGASGKMRGAAESATGQSTDDIMAQIKDWVSKNQMGAGAAAGGLGAVVLGTKAGRALAGKAIKIGSLALIGGLAYKALQNYQAGRPLISGGDAGVLAEAPRGTGYETSAVTQESAVLYIRAMIAAAAADGRIDANEQQKIFGSLKQAGMEAGAEEFIARELNNPASVEDLVAAVKTEQEAVQVFTAARVAVELDSQANNDFLVNLANGLGIDGQLAQHIDAAARHAA
jgi:uncharacterized membrane protein YebE (DUF533 family)